MVFGFRRGKGESQRQDPPPATASSSGTSTRNSSTPSSSSGFDSIKAIQQFRNAHNLDPNLPVEDLHDDYDSTINESTAEKAIRIEAVAVEENSPYPEVRATVRNYDEDLPANTIRAWVIGMLLCTLGSGINMLFSLRDPSVTITTFVIQLVAYPIGLGWDLIFPDRVWNVFGLKFNLRPGRFNYKEHVIITVMSNAAYGGGHLYATDVIVAQEMWYKQSFGWLWQILFGITTLCTGYGLAGLVRRFLVWPAAMIWPSDLVNASLFYTLHDHSPSDPKRTNGWSIGRYKFFLIIFAGSFFWYWFPGWIFQGLTWFSWICWIYPKSMLVNQLFGAQSGYGLLPITLDWTIIVGYISSPLIPPFHAIANTMVGVVVFFVFVSMGIHFSGTWYSDYLPVSNSYGYDNRGALYSTRAIMDENNHFDEAAYHAYSPLYLPTNFALAYGLAFAAIAAVIVHVALYNGREIWTQYKQARNQEDDIHMRLMKKYPDAPDWWYAALFLVMFAISMVVVCAWPTGFPWWAYIICMLIPIVWTLPIGVVQAVTNVQLGLNVFTEYIIGYMLPGRPLAMMMFKNYGYLCMGQALYFVQDLKLGHYMKVPPRTMFWSQLIASIWSAIVQICVMNWALANIPDVCNPEVADHRFTCANAKVFYTASIVWGAIGPARIFGANALYASLQWFWLVGALAPVVTWFFARRYKKSLWRYISFPLIFGGAGSIPPATVYMYLCWGIVGTVFNFFLKRRYNGWWLQYNYITSAALDSGLIIATIIIFFTLFLTDQTPPEWFGNKEALSTADMAHKAIAKQLARGQTFGPKSWP